MRDFSFVIRISGARFRMWSIECDKMCYSHTTLELLLMNRDSIVAKTTLAYPALQIGCVDKNTLLLPGATVEIIPVPGDDCLQEQIMDLKKAILIEPALDQSEIDSWNQ
jgi:hypothetical protein